jgi:hypothetical protein
MLRGFPTALLLAGAIALAAPPAFAQAGSRHEMRSYQPYSGLQVAPVVPLPPAERGAERKRLETPAPVPRSPVLVPGAPAAYTAQWYLYCAAKYQSFEPGTGLYTTFSGKRRICR